MDNYMLGMFEKYLQAERSGDIVALSEQLHEKFIGIGPNGFVLDKKQWLERHKNGKLIYDLLDTDALKIRVFADTAIVVARLNQSGSYGDRRVKMVTRISTTFIKENGEWMIIGLQLSPFTPST